MSTVGSVAKLLSSEKYTPLSTLSSLAYLINPMVIMLITMSGDTPFHIDFYLMAVIAIGFLVIVYLTALVVMLFVQIPVGMMISLVIKS